MRNFFSMVVMVGLAATVTPVGAAQAQYINGYRSAESMARYLAKAKPCYFWAMPTYKNSAFGPGQVASERVYCVFDAVTGRGINEARGCAFAYFDAAADGYVSITPGIPVEPTNGRCTPQKAEQMFAPERESAWTQNVDLASNWDTLVGIHLGGKPKLLVGGTGPVATIKASLQKKMCARMKKPSAQEGFGCKVERVEKGNAGTQFTAAKPMVIGSLTEKAVHNVINRNRGQVRYCFEAHGRSPPQVDKVVVKFVITASGTVAEARSVTETTANNDKLESCLSGRVRTWTFPEPRGGGEVIVTYSFGLQPQN